LENDFFDEPNFEQFSSNKKSLGLMTKHPAEARMDGGPAGWTQGGALGTQAETGSNWDFLSTHSQTPRRASPRDPTNPAKPVLLMANKFD